MVIIDSVPQVKVDENECDDVRGYQGQYAARHGYKAEVEMPIVELKTLKHDEYAVLPWSFRVGG